MFCNMYRKENQQTVLTGQKKTPLVLRFQCFVHRGYVPVLRRNGYLIHIHCEVFAAKLQKKKRIFL